MTSVNLCARCAGRTFGRRKSKEKDYTLTMAAQLPEEYTERFVDPMNCGLCHGLVEVALSVLPKILSTIQRYEFDTFLIGVHLGRDYRDADTIFIEQGISPLLLKFEVSRELGLRIEETLNKKVDFTQPELMITIDSRRRGKIRYKVRSASLYILGRYKKLVRTIPQTKWPCSSCKGRGCNGCEGTGLQYRESVESIVASPFVRYSGASDESFHGAGREDIDARMLGSGRPFVLELKDPKVRSIPLDRMEQEVNLSDKVKISDLRIVSKRVVSQIKTSSPDSKKVYLARVCTGGVPLDVNVTRDKISQQSFPLLLRQRTPLRVSHRRADLVREKYIYDIRIEEHSGDTMLLKITAQGGAYIKEFISGDGGRTSPSVSSILSTDCVCTELDVLMVEDHGLFSSDHPEESD